MEGLQEKLDKLRTSLRGMGSIVVAFSGGVDSTFLLKVAHEVLGDNVMAIMARSSTYPEREYREADDFAASNNIKHVTIVSEELEIEGFSENPINRCYLCKHELYSKIIEFAKENGISVVADGTNVDDLGDYRPGLQAISELGVISPLKDAGLTKVDIRNLSRQLGLRTWDKPAFACLSSRFPYGQKITKEKLEMVDKAEQHLLDLGFKQVRVRHHGDIARIEVAVYERKKFFNEQMMDEVSDEFKKIGFLYTTLDLGGYRTGSMNETLK